jgi:hypothetical protein
MVSRPAAQAERTFFKVACGGGIGVLVLMVIVVFGWWGDAKRSVVIAPSSPEPTHLVPQAANAVGPQAAGGLGKTSKVDSSAPAAETAEKISKPKEAPILEVDEK